MRPLTMLLYGLTELIYILSIFIYITSYDDVMFSWALASIFPH